MAVRIRKNGRIYCAAVCPARKGDTYIDDSLYYILSVEKKVLVTQSMSEHKKFGEWWWSGSVPKHIRIDSFYLIK